MKRLLLAGVMLAAMALPAAAYTSLRVLQLEESLEYATEEGDQEYISKLSKNLREAKAAEDAGHPLGPILGDNGQVSLGMFECNCIPAGATNVGPGAPAPNPNPPDEEEETGTTPPPPVVTPPPPKMCDGRPCGVSNPKGDKGRANDRGRRGSRRN